MKYYNKRQCWLSSSTFLFELLGSNPGSSRAISGFLPWNGTNYLGNVPSTICSPGTRYNAGNWVWVGKIQYKYLNLCTTCLTLFISWCCLFWGHTGCTRSLLLTVQGSLLSPLRGPYVVIKIKSGLVACKTIIIPTALYFLPWYIFVYIIKKCQKSWAELCHPPILYVEIPSLIPE